MNKLISNALKLNVLLIIIGIFLISISSAWSNNAFNNSLTTENLTYINTCYQESANTTNQSGTDGNCGLSYSGSYDGGVDNTWRDGNWDTFNFYDLNTGQYVDYFVNYTYYFTNSTNVTWNLKIRGNFGATPTLNVTIPNSCINYASNNDKLILKMRHYYLSGTSYVYLYCQNTTGLSLFNTTSDVSIYGNLYEESITYGGNDIIRYLSIPSSVSVLTNAKLNLSGFELILNSTNRSFDNIKYAYDNDLTTKAEWYSHRELAGNRSIYFGRYTQNKSIGNVTINSSFYMAYTLGGSNGGNKTLYLQSYDGSSWNTEAVLGTYQGIIPNGNGTGIVSYDNNYSLNKYVSGIRLLFNYTCIIGNCDAENDYYLVINNLNFTGMTDYSISPYLLINNITVWNYTGTFNQSNNQTSNFANAINNYLGTCTYTGGYCNVPFVFHSDAPGILQYSALSFNDSGFIENSITYNANTQESESETFTLNVTFGSGSLPQYASLYYNGNTYPSVITNTGGTNYNISNIITIPINNGSSLHSFYWNVTYSNTAITYTQVSSSNNQTVGEILLVYCNSTYNVTYVNFTIKDEQTYLLLNSSFEALLNYWSNSSDGTIYKNTLYANLTDNNSNYQFCGYPSGKYLTVAGVVSYYKTGYDRREYWFNEANFNNLSTNINLYLLSTASSDTFTFTIKDEADRDVEGAYIYVQKWDIGTNNFYTVGILTTSNDGTASINIRLTDTWYRYVVVYNGITYLTTDPVKETTTSRILRIRLTEQNLYDYFYGVSHDLTFNNNTNVFTFVFTDSSGNTAVGCLKMFKDSEQISNECINTASGTISYVTTENGTYVAQGILTLSETYSSVSSIVDTLTKSIGKPEKYIIINDQGRVITLLATGTAAVVGVAAGSIPLGLGLIAAALIGTSYLGFIDLRDSIWYIISIMLLIIIVAIRRSGR